MTRAVHRLQIAGPAGAVYRITDGAARCVGTGMNRLDIDLPQGIYTVSASLGRSVETREVMLDEPQSIELHTTLPSFGDQAFGLAPDVLTALGPHEFRLGGQLIALRGPWRDAQAAADVVALERDGRAVAAVRTGLLSDPSGRGVWSWQLFDLGTARATAAKPAGFSITRSVCDEVAPTPAPTGKDAKNNAQNTPPPQKVSHVLPHWGDWMVWAAYPATACGAPEGVDLPMAHYLRLRLTLPGVAPVASLQSLSDQIFTALAARTGLPLTKPVLDLLLSDEADPLLGLAAAHLASITLASLGRLGRLPHDASTSPMSVASNTPSNELAMIDTEALYQRFFAWLKKHSRGPLSKAPDMVAARFLFGIGTRARVRVPPVLLRSLDGLIAAVESPQAQAAGTTCDETVWGPRLQVSDSFAFLQWQPDADYEQELLNNMKRSLENMQAMQSTAQLIAQAKAQVAQEKRAASNPRAAQAEPAGRVAPSRPSPAARSPKPAAPQKLDLEAFIKNNVTSLRIPTSAMSQLSSVLGSLSIDQNSITNVMQQLTDQLKKS